MARLEMKEVKSKVEQRQKMVNYLHAIVPELRQLASTLKLTRKADGTLNKRDKDKLDAIIKAYQSTHEINAYLKVDKYSIMLHTGNSSISKSIVISDDLGRYGDIADYQAYTVEQVITALKRKEAIKEGIRKLQSEDNRLEIDFDLGSYDFWHEGDC